MPSLTLSRVAALRETNLRLSFWLETSSTASSRAKTNRASSVRPAVATPEHLASLLSELLRAGAELRAEPFPVPGDDPALDREIDVYRKHVERLRELLPAMHDQLLAERARLEGQRARVRSAAEWARASRQTL